MVEEEERYISMLPLSRVASEAEADQVASGVSSRSQLVGAAELLALLPQMVETVPAPLIVVDERFRVVVANAAARLFLSADNGSFVGYSIRRFLSFEKLEEARLTLLSRPGRHNYRDMLTVNDVERKVDVHLDLLDAEGTEYLCMTLSDRTNFDRERAEWRDTQDSEPPKSRLERAHHLEALGHLTGTLAHDFNNLLSVILGSLDAVTRCLDRGRDPRADLERAKTATIRSIQSTGQVLRYARHREAECEALDPGEVVRELHGLIERAVGPRISIKVETQETPGVYIGAAQLETTLLNLVVNARDALDEADGEITVSLSTRELDPDSAASTGLIPGSYVVVAVSDNGTGMDEALQERVFEPFFTTKAEGHGTGLGLSTVRSLVRKLGGGVVLHSKLGVGTRIELLFPVAN